jgi:hypothetical protein
MVWGGLRGAVGLALAIVVDRSLGKMAQHELEEHGRLVALHASTNDIGHLHDADTHCQLVRPKATPVVRCFITLTTFHLVCSRRKSTYCRALA